MVKVTDLAPEILSKIALEVYTPRDPGTGIYYGPSMRSLALSCRAWNTACYPYRFHDWELVTESYKNLDKHIKNDKWRATVRILVVPLTDLRSEKGKRRRTLEEYDAKLAEVVKAANRLETIGLCLESFEDGSEEMRDMGPLPILERTLQACREKASVKELRIRGINFQWQASAICTELQHWPNVHSLRCYRGTGSGTNELQLGQTIYTGAANCASLRRLTFDLPILTGGPEGTPEICPAANSLTHLDLGDLYLRHPILHGSAMASIIQNHMATLRSLTLWTECLDVALQSARTPLRFPKLDYLHLKTPLGGSGSVPLQGALLVEQGPPAVVKLRTLLASCPLKAIHLSGSHSIHLAAHLMHEYRATFAHLREITMDIGFEDSASWQEDIIAINKLCMETTGITVQWMDGEAALLEY